MPRGQLPDPVHGRGGHGAPTSHRASDPSQGSRLRPNSAASLSAPKPGSRTVRDPGGLDRTVREPARAATAPRCPMPRATAPRADSRSPDRSCCRSLPTPSTQGRVPRRDPSGTARAARGHPDKRSGWGAARGRRDLGTLLRAGTVQQRKALFRLLVKQPCVMSREEIVPTYTIPALVRAPEGQVEVSGLEPPTSAVRRQRSTGLSYTPRSQEA